MSYPHRQRQDSRFDDDQLDEATRQSIQDAYAPRPPVNTAYDDEQAQIRRAEQESLQDAYAPRYGRQEDYGAYGRGGYQGPGPDYAAAGRGGGYQGSAQETAAYGRGGGYQGPPQGYGRGGGFGGPGNDGYGYARPPRPEQPEFAPPPGRPPQEQFGDAGYPVPSDSAPVDDYGRPIAPHPQGQGHHHHHHQQEENEYGGGGNAYSGGAGGYQGGPTGLTSQEYNRRHPPPTSEHYGQEAHHGRPSVYNEEYGAQPSADGWSNQAAPHPVTQPATTPHHGTASEYYNNEPPQPRPHQEQFYDAQEGRPGDDGAPPPPAKPQNAARPNLQNAANFASLHRQDSVQEQEMFNAAAAHVASQQAQGHADGHDDDEPTPTVHPHTVNSSSTPTQMGQAAAMSALQHLTGGGGGGAGGIASILGGVAGGGGAGAALSGLLGGGGGAAGSAPSGPPAAAAAAHAAAPPSSSNAPSGAPAASSAPTSPAEKLIAVAMMKASELFDKNGSGDPVAKQQAVQAAASTVMKLVNRYQSGGASAGGQFNPGEIQGLFGTFMKAFA